MSGPEFKLLKDEEKWVRARKQRGVCLHQRSQQFKAISTDDMIIGFRHYSDNIRQGRYLVWGQGRSRARIILNKFKVPIKESDQSFRIALLLLAVHLFVVR